MTARAAARCLWRGLSRISQVLFSGAFGVLLTLAGGRGSVFEIHASPTT